MNGHFAPVSTHSLACRDFPFISLYFLQIRVLPTKDVFAYARQLASRWPCDPVTTLNSHHVLTSTRSLACRDSISKIKSFVRRTSSLAYVDWTLDGHAIQ